MICWFKDNAPSFTDRTGLWRRYSCFSRWIFSLCRYHSPLYWVNPPNKFVVPLICDPLVTLCFSSSFPWYRRRRFYWTKRSHELRRFGDIVHASFGCALCSQVQIPLSVSRNRWNCNCRRKSCRTTVQACLSSKLGSMAVFCWYNY